jgi:hypothetical protein
VLGWLPVAKAASLQSRARDAAAPYTTESGVEFPGVALLAYGKVGQLAQRQ